MVYRIDYQHFLTHMIDHFSREDLLHFQYLIASAAVASRGMVDNVAKSMHLYPDTDVVCDYAKYQDKELMEKQYLKNIEPEPNDGDWFGSVIYSCIVEPLMKHVDIVLVCDRAENDFLDVICKYLKKRFHIEVIDLNELFTKGYTGEIHIDRDKIRNSAVDIRRSAGKSFIENLEKTKEGREKIMKRMTKKMKIKKLKELGIDITERDTDRIDDLLVEVWVNDQD